MNRDALAKRIAETAVLHGEFTLRSGRKSHYYIDKYRFETQPDVLDAVGRLIAAEVDDSIDRIAGPELGAVALAASASIHAKKPALFIRNQKKEYGSNKQIEGAFEPGDRVLLVEDIITSGGQVVEAVKTLTDAGLVVAKIVVSVDRLEGARKTIEQTGVPLVTLFTIADLGVEGPH